MQLTGGNQVAALNRRGRKRKSGYRKPSGDIVLAHENLRLLAMEWPHRRIFPPADRLSEKAGHTLGGLNLAGLLNELQYRAGLLYAGDVNRYMDSIEPPQVGSMGDPDSGGGGGGRAPYMDPEIALRRKQRYDAAFEALGEAGQQAAKAVRLVAVYGHPPGADGLIHLIRGLDRLVTHYGLTPGRFYGRGGK